MAAEYSGNAAQVVPVNGAVIFTETPVPCRLGLIYHRDDSGIFRVANRFFRQNVMQCWRRNTNYLVSFRANIAVPEGETVPTAPEGISLAIAVDGDIDPSSTMIYTPTVVETFGNVGAEIVVTVPCLCSCSSVSVRNTSTIPITVQNANMTIDLA